MDISLVLRMKELEAENARPHKMYVEAKLKADSISAVPKKWFGHLRREMA